jgi:hypothetical protein
MPKGLLKLKHASLVFVILKNSCDAELSVEDSRVLEVECLLRNSRRVDAIDEFLFFSGLVVFLNGEVDGKFVSRGEVFGVVVVVRDEFLKMKLS